MESDQPTAKSNQILNQYLFHMESEIGHSGRTLHQILSEFMKLKEQSPSLAFQIEDFELPASDVISMEQFDQWSKVLRRLQTLRQKALQGLNEPSEHPWYGIAHADHKPEEFDALVRSVRFLSIQLNKLWVEIQSVPLFLNALDHATITEIERIFRWILSSPNWSDIIAQPRVIPALSQAESRKVLLDFARDVKSIRLLREKLQSHSDSKFLDPSFSQAGLDLAAEALNLMAHYQLSTITKAKLDDRVQEIETKVSKLERIQAFFGRISVQHQITPAKTVSEARKILFLSTVLSQIPARVMTMRSGKILESGQEVRLSAWKGQAQVLLEARKRIENHFRIKDPISADDLRKLSQDLSSAGALRVFNAAYQAAVQRYQKLLRTDVHADLRKKRKESQSEMASRVLEWASYLDELKKFEEQSDLRSVMGVYYKGVDTDFELALQSNSWAARLRADLRTDTDPFGAVLMEYVTQSLESNLTALNAQLLGHATGEIRQSLNDLDFAADIELSSVLNQQKLELTDLKRMQSVITRLGLQPDTLFSNLEEIKMMMEEHLFLSQQMDSNAELKQWLRTAYRGGDTDLTVIEQSLVYIQYIEAAEIPDSLKNTFISAYGPQRLSESRSLVSTSWGTIETLKDQIQKLDFTAHNQLKNLLSQSVPALLTQVHQALKQPHLLQEWVDYIQCERDAKSLGLTVLLDFYEKKHLFGWPMDQVLELTYLSSLLKKAIAKDENPNKKPRTKEYSN